MNERVAVTRGKRLLLAGIAMAVAILLTTIVLTIRDTIRLPDADWHSMGGNIQLVLACLFSQLLVAIATYPVFTAPLVLLLPATAQLRYWYGIVVASLLWVPFLLFCLRAFTLRELWTGSIGRGFPIAALLDLPSLLSCCLYLVLLRQAQRRSEDMVTVSSSVAR